MGFAALFLVILLADEEDHESVESTDLGVESTGVPENVPTSVTSTTLSGGLALPGSTVIPEDTVTTSTTIPAAETVSLAFVGDMMLGSNYPPIRLPANDAVGVFEPVQSLLEADLTVGNLEGPITEQSGDKCGAGSSNCFAFRMPLHYIDRFRDAGFDALNVANNHGNDMGPLGLDDTVRIVDGAGIAAYGQAGTVDHLEVNGITISLIGFTTYPPFNNLLELQPAIDLVTAESKLSDVVVVTFHAGSEGADASHVANEMEYLSGEPRGNLVLFSHSVIDAGADLVVGHGPHVLRGMELYKDRLIAYSLGNFATYGFTTSGPNGQSGVFHVSLDAEGTYSDARFDSVRLTSEGYPEPDPDGGSLATVQQLSLDDFGDAAAPLTDDGSILTLDDLAEFAELAARSAEAAEDGEE